MQSVAILYCYAERLTECLAECLAKCCIFILLCWVSHWVLRFCIVMLSVVMQIAAFFGIVILNVISKCCIFVLLCWVSYSVAFLIVILTVIIQNLTFLICYAECCCCCCERSHFCIVMLSVIVASHILFSYAWFCHSECHIFGIVLLSVVILSISFIYLLLIVMAPSQLNVTAHTIHQCRKTSLKLPQMCN